MRLWWRSLIPRLHNEASQWEISLFHRNDKAIFLNILRKHEQRSWIIAQYFTASVWTNDYGRYQIQWCEVITEIWRHNIMVTESWLCKIAWLVLRAQCSWHLKWFWNLLDWYYVIWNEDWLTEVAENKLAVETERMDKCWYDTVEFRNDYKAGCLLDWTIYHSSELPIQRFYYLLMVEM